MNKAVFDEILDKKVIAIVRGVQKTEMVDTVEALMNGGVNCIEITFNQESEETIKDTVESLKVINEKFGNSICLGAGTVVNKRQVELAAEAGAEYMISPNTDIEVIKFTKSLGKISIPGAFTPSEMVTAYNSGADIVKLFPAGIMGIDYLKALMAPLKHIPIVAVGGIRENNIGDFIKSGVAGVGIGGNLVDTNAIRAKDFKRITYLAKTYMQNSSR